MFEVGMKNIESQALVDPKNTRLMNASSSCARFPSLHTNKLTEGISVGSDIRKLLLNEEFNNNEYSSTGLDLRMLSINFLEISICTHATQ
ncbi:hypothetical protein PR048_016133 [Dryococelus australis]|uniref:Uncharacterized protein n=1 Tax=Dryococelus australis TaxID=614101 RepID=A0ABQ9HIW2_9NEOP|nr:hypothetical protein PR048_016133 [Dryococelus australis]